MILAGHLGALIYSSQAHPYWLDRFGTSRPYLWAEVAYEVHPAAIQAATAVASSPSPLSSQGRMT